MSEWYKNSKLAEFCQYGGDIAERCQDCQPDGNCETCNTIDGRDMDVVNQYASTCDWCSEPAMHESMEMDPVTQLGYCEECQKLQAVQEILRKARTTTDPQAGANVAQGPRNGAGMED